MANLYTYDASSGYLDLPRTNGNLKLVYNTKALASGTNKSVYYPVTPGDQLRFQNMSAAREIPASGNATTNEWFFGVVANYASGQVVKPLSGTTSQDGWWIGTVPSGYNYFIIVTASTNTSMVNTNLNPTVQKYVNEIGWVTISPKQFGSNISVPLSSLSNILYFSSN